MFIRRHPYGFPLAVLIALWLLANAAHSQSSPSAPSPNGLINDVAQLRAELKALRAEVGISNKQIAATVKGLEATRTALLGAQTKINTLAEAIRHKISYGDRININSVAYAGKCIDGNDPQPHNYQPYNETPVRLWSLGPGHKNQAWTIDTAKGSW